MSTTDMIQPPSMASYRALRSTTSTRGLPIRCVGNGGNSTIVSASNPRVSASAGNCGATFAGGAYEPHLR